MRQEFLTNLRSVFNRRRVILIIFACIIGLFLHHFSNEGIVRGTERTSSKSKTSNSQEAEQTLPVLMYHHFVEDGEPDGVTMTKKRFLEDMEYLEENGYTPLLPSDLKQIRIERMKWPEKPIMITIDDGYESNYKIAFPILCKTGMKATIFAIANSMDNPSEVEAGRIPKLTWDQMKVMYKSGFVDIQSHSYNLHNSDSNGAYLRDESNGMQRLSGETKGTYEWRIDRDVSRAKKLIEEKVGNEVTCLAYPYGAYDPWVEKVLKSNGIEYGFIVEDKPADLEGEPYRINRYYMSMDTDLSDILE